MTPQRVDDRVDIEMRQHDLMPAAQQMRHGVKPRTMRQRAGMQARVALVERIDVGVIAMAHEEQIAMGQHRSLGLAGRPARIKEPRSVGGAALDGP